jgi:protein transport protein SEC61 subunit alpha
VSANPPRFGERSLWTAVVLLIFLVLGQIPLFGLDKLQKSDPFFWARTVMASNKGTLMELGISPIITSGMVIQLIQGARIIHVDVRVAEDRALLKATTKFFGILLTFTQAFLYVYSGAYGSISELGMVKASLIVLQLSIAGILLILLDEMLSKGYGLSQGGISLFIAVGVAETIMWKSFSPMTLNTGRGAEFEGAIVASFHMLLTRPDKFKALREAFFRANLPNLSNVLMTVIVFVVVVFLQGYRKIVPFKHTVQRGATTQYEVKLYPTQRCAPPPRARLQPD